MCLPSYYAFHYLSLLEAFISPAKIFKSINFLSFKTHSLFMEFIYAILVFSAVVSSVSAAPTFPRGSMKRDIDAALIPQFGHAAGLNPTGTGNCDGTTNSAGVVVEVPCSCPPDRNLFIQVISNSTPIYPNRTYRHM